ncbi:Protein eyes shut [Manis javanica]|nr:Protein eyes shut [Manis javanica]
MYTGRNNMCINKRGKWNKQGYECICRPPFAGTNCSEIIGQCQPLICFHGTCSNITANNCIYECDEPFSVSSFLNPLQWLSTP